MPPLIVTQSSLRVWRRCHNLYGYKYVEKLRPKSITRPLVFGTAIHRIAEYAIEGKTPAQAVQEINKDRSLVFSAEVDHWDQIIKDATIIMGAYRQFYKNDPLKFPIMKGKKTEFQFEHKLTPKISLRGKIDAIPQTDDGRRWIMEHKSRRGRIENDSVRTRDLQTMIYAHVAETELGIKRIGGVLWDYIRSKTPTVPDLLKNGSLSKSRIDTLPVQYMAAIKEHQLNPRHYTEVLKVLEANLPTWFRRVRLPINRHAIESLMDEATFTAKEIDKNAGIDRTRNLTQDCSWCPMERLCTAELFNLDSKVIREREYRVSEKVHTELEDLEE
jgi:hypothetical protein